MIYLDTEIESQEVNTALQTILVTIKLRLLDELGRRLVIYYTYAYTYCIDKYISMTLILYIDIMYVCMIVVKEWMS